MSYEHGDLQPLGRGGLSHRRPAPFERFWFGACYYPEHWDAATRADDARRMREAGFNLVRMGEFAWDLIEPEEGRFDFGLFDETIATLGAAGLRTMFCTPTATPPRWLSRRHPEILRRDHLDQALQHGSRQHASHFSSVYRAHSRRITAVLAEHFRGNPHLVAWQTDNEFHCHVHDDHHPEAVHDFQDWLAAKYHGDIKALNRAWGTAFWAQTCRSFADVTSPRKDRPTYLSPGQLLDWNRFLAWGAARFQHEQVGILRAADARWWITHNGLFPAIDYRGAFTRDLDVLGWDCYPGFAYEHGERHWWQLACLDQARAWSGNLIIPEQQSGPGGQAPYLHDTPEPGEVRAMTLTSLARGVDSLMYFRWRSCRFGAEEYWCGILDHDDIPRRRYHEVAQVGRELATLGPRLLGTHVHVDCAVAAADLDVHLAHEALPLGLPHPRRLADGILKALHRRHHAAGAIHPLDDLGGVKLYVIPHWELVEAAWLPALETFVAGGGVLVVGARSASRDADNQVVPASLPGCLRRLCACTVEEYTKQNRPEQRRRDVVLAGQHAHTEHWAEILVPDAGTEVVATWEGGHFSGRAAITAARHGAGQVVYAGCYLVGEVLDLLMPELIRRAGLAPILPGLPDGVGVYRRDAADRSLYFAINHGEDEIDVELPAGRDLLGGGEGGGRLRLPRHGVAVVEVSRSA